MGSELGCRTLFCILKDKRENRVGAEGEADFEFLLMCAWVWDYWMGKGIIGWGISLAQSHFFFAGRMKGVKEWVGTQS